MKKLFIVLLIFPLLSYSTNNSLLLLSKNKYSFISETNLLKNNLSAPPKKKSTGGGSIKDVPWLISGGMIVVGSAIAIYYGYNQKNVPALAITGGGIAIVGGVLATIRVFTLSKKGKLFGMTEVPNTSVAIAPNGVKVIHRF